MSRNPVITIGGRAISRDVPPYAIAEIGINHGGSLERAAALVHAAADAGAHAIKLQTIVARDLVSPACPAPAHVQADSLVQFFEQFELGEAAHASLVSLARQLGLAIMSTPFSLASVELLDRLGVDALKIASGDLTWLQLIARCASTGRPLVLSTGMATLPEVHQAIATARGAGATDIALLHCVSSYPVPHGSENLLAIRTLADACGVPVGLSDHAADTFSAPLAVALGGSLYERHLVLPDDPDAIDRDVSSTPDELHAAVAAMRRAWTALGTGYKACLAAEAVNAPASRRSLCAARDLPAGATLAADDLVALRPATGITPADLPAVCGRRLLVARRRGEPIRWDDLCEPRALPAAPRVEETPRVA